MSCDCKHTDGFCGLCCPAFPFVLDREKEYHYGVSRRDYFAAHAPAEIPSWFEPTMRPRPAEPPNLPDLSGIPIFENIPFLGEKDMDAAGRRNYIYNHAERWRRDSHYDLVVDGQYPNPGNDRLVPLWDAARERLTAFEAQWLDHREQLAVWQEEREQARVAQWVWAWADLVLGAGETRG